MSVTVPTLAEFNALNAKVTTLATQQAQQATTLSDLGSRVTALENPVILPPPVLPPPPPVTGFHEPAGLTLLDQTDWTNDVGQWWRNYNTPDKPITTLVVPDGPQGVPSPVLQIGYLAGHQGGGGTELGRWITPVNELYWRYAVRVNPTWQGHSSGINKMVFVDDASPPQSGPFSAMWYEMFGSGANPLGLYLVYDSAGETGYADAQQQVVFTRGQWALVEIHQVQGQLVEVWVDGVLRIRRTGITKASPIGLLVISGIWGGVGDTKAHFDFMQFGPLYLSGR